MNFFKNLAKERNELVMKYAKGRLIDIGCGEENYIEKHRPHSLGIDKGDEFPLNNPFDTVTMVAVLNYLTVQEQNDYLDKIRKVLMPGGRLIITCVTPLGSFLKRLTCRDGEKEHGISREKIFERVLCKGFSIIFWKTFNFGLNTLMVFQK